MRLGGLDIPPEPEPDAWELAASIAAPIALGVGALLVALVLLFRWLKRQMRVTGEARLRARYPGAPPLRADPTALFFGVRSRGRGQLRGNGVLALAADEVWSSLFAGGDALAIPLASILAVDTCEDHLGKRIAGRRLLRIRFRRGDDEDVAAWLVDDPEAWRAAVDEARAAAAPPGA